MVRALSLLPISLRPQPCDGRFESKHFDEGLEATAMLFATLHRLNFNVRGNKDIIARHRACKKIEFEFEKQISGANDDVMLVLSGLSILLNNCNARKVTKSRH